MSTKVISLSLEKRSGKSFSSVSVVERESGREGGSGKTPEGSLSDDSSPSGLSLVNCVEKSLISIRRIFRKINFDFWRGRTN